MAAQCYHAYKNHEGRLEQFTFRLLKKNKMVGDLEEVIEWHHTKTCHCFVMFAVVKNKYTNNM